MDALFAWPGGKARLRKRILPLIPEHRCYVEPFFGAGWIFFAKEPAKVEVLNDIDGDLVNLYRVLQRHPDELWRTAEFVLAARQNHRLFRREQEGLTDVERAVRTLFLITTSFGAKITGPFAARRWRPSSWMARRWQDRLDEIHTRLRAAQIESLPFRQCLERYDAPRTFAYIDPPYYQVKGCYRHELTPEQHQELRGCLGNLKGKWLLSINDVAEIRALYQGFRRRRVQTMYSLGRRGNKSVGELLISNY